MALMLSIRGKMEVIMDLTKIVKGLVKIVVVDPYWKKTLKPVSSSLPTSAIFVAESSASYEAIGTTESYWLRQDDNNKMSSLWCQSDEVGNEYYCCALISVKECESPADCAAKMLMAFLLSRAPYAVSFCGFTKEGLLDRKWQDEFTLSYRKAIEPLVAPPDAKPGEGELYYDDGSLRYRGEIVNELAHGRGKGYWPNGNPWCEGYFKDNKPNGECCMYLKNGSLRHEGNFHEGYPKGQGKEYYDDGQLWFEGIYDSQTIRYGWGGRRYVRGRLYDRDGNLKHDGEFESCGHSCQPIKEVRGRT
jgi:hypothetical protein